MLIYVFRCNSQFIWYEQIKIVGKSDSLTTSNEVALIFPVSFKLLSFAEILILPYF